MFGKKKTKFDVSEFANRIKDNVIYKSNIYGVYDLADKCHTEIFVARSDISARRYFIQKINTANEMITHRYKSQGLDVPPAQLTDVKDFELHLLAQFDDIFGSVKPVTVKTISLTE